MNANKTLKYVVPCLSLLAVAISPVQAADTGATVVSGEVVPKLIYFDYTGNAADGLTSYLQSYAGQEAWSGNRDHGAYADFDASLTFSNAERDLLTLERRGYGIDNHRGQAQGGSESVGFSGYYSHFRVNSGAIDYLIRPGTVDNPVATIPPYDPAGNAGYLTLFNDDSTGQTDYYIERTRYGLELKFKPELLGKGTSLALNADGYRREGTTFATWAAGNGDITPNSAAQKQARWRGYDKPVDENMGRFALNFTAAPAGLFQFAYDGSLEKFSNRARTADMMDFQANVEGPGTAPTGLTMVGDAQLHFVPDSTLMTNAVRVSRTFSSTALAAGYGMSTLSQDSFSDDQVAAGYTTGEINTQNAFLSVNQRLTPRMGLEGYVKYYNRDNDSTDAPPGGLLDRNVRDEWGVRINNIESLTYGLSATVSSLPVKSSLTVGWKREDTERDLQYNFITATTNIGIWPTVSLYSDATLSDEFYLRWVARPMQGMTFRLTPSIVQADKTALVTEAEESLNVKAALGYAVNQQAYVGAYYRYKDKENGQHSFTDTNKPTGGPIVLGNEYEQKADDTFHSAGLSLTHNPSEWVTLSANLDWSQNDFETYYFGTTVRRFEANVVFDPRGTSGYKIDTWSLGLNAEYQPTDPLKLRAGYILSKSEGDLSTTTTALADVVSDRIEHSIHTVALSADYALSPTTRVWTLYSYDYYDDQVYRYLTGGVNTIVVGLALQL